MASSDEYQQRRSFETLEESANRILSYFRKNNKRELKQMFDNDILRIDYQYRFKKVGGVTKIEIKNQINI